MRMRWLFGALVALLLVGCAKFPDSGTGGFTKRLIMKMSMDGAIRTGLESGGSGLPYVYIFALRLSTDETPTTTGPLPVVTPGGNGFVAGHCTHFVLWNPLASPQYTIWQFNDETTLNEWTQIGVPINYKTIAVGDKELECEIDLSQLVPAGTVDTIKGIQINFLTMNNTLVTGGGRVWDALGDGRNPGDINRPFLFQPRVSQTFNNTNQSLIEPTDSDCVDPDLDLRDWSVEVSLP